MESWIAIIGLLVALWQLRLQRLELQRGNHIEMLRVVADIVRGEIALSEKIIAEEKARENPRWDARIRPHADKVNKVLRPKLRSVEKEILQICSGRLPGIEELRKAYGDLTTEVEGQDVRAQPVPAPYSRPA